MVEQRDRLGPVDRVDRAGVASCPSPGRCGRGIVENLRRGHYELGIEAEPHRRVTAAFTELDELMTTLQPLATLLLANQSR